MKRFFIPLTVLLACLLAFVACTDIEDPVGTSNDSHTTAIQTPEVTEPHETETNTSNSTGSVTEPEEDTNHSTDTDTGDETPDETTSPEPETVHTHVWGDWSTTKEATCTETGMSERTCACGESEQQSIDALGHTEVVDAAVAPTVTENGLTEGKHCSVCNEVLIQQETVPATGSLGLAYELNSNGTAYIVTGIGTCEDSVVYIPEVYNGLRVTEIARRAFYDCATMTEITIPASITTIGTQIFYKAENLHTVYYNSTYGSSDNPFFSQSSVKKIVFGGKTVPGYILYDRTVAVDVVVSNNVTSIGGSAFEGCKGLNSIVIPDSVTSIGSSAFSGCKGLKDVYITDVEAWLNISFDGYYSHPNCYGSLHILDENGKEVTDLVIPNSVTRIDEYAFNNCTGLTSIVIPDSVKSIGDDAFLGCNGALTIYGAKGSYAETFANEKGIKFAIIEGV